MSIEKYIGVNRNIHYNVGTIAERDLIPINSDSREIGTLCLVKDKGTGDPGAYMLVGGIDNINWVEQAYYNSNGYTLFGNETVSFMYFDTVFPNAQGSFSVTNLNGLDASKVLFIGVNGMWANGGAYISNSYTWQGTYQYDWYMNNGINPAFLLNTIAGNSLSILNKPCKIFAVVKQ